MTEIKRERLQIWLQIWHEAWQEMDEWAGGEILDHLVKPPSMEAGWVAQDLCSAAGWLVAIGGEQELPSYWRMAIGGSVALIAGKVVISELQELKQDISKLLKFPPPAGMSLEEKLLYVLYGDSQDDVFGNLLDANEEEILHTRLRCWAAGLAIRQSSHCEPLGHMAYKLAGKLGVHLTISDDPGAQYVQLLSVLKQAEAEADEVLADPIISSWLQEDVKQVKKDPLVKTAIEAKIVDLPKIFS